MAVIRKKGLVSLVMDEFTASLFAPQQLAELDRTRPGWRFEDDDPICEDYIVEVRRITDNTERSDGGLAARHTWMAVIKVNGEEWRIPGAVLERIIRYREGLINEAKVAAGKEIAELRATRKKPATAPALYDDNVPLPEPALAPSFLGQNDTEPEDENYDC